MKIDVQMNETEVLTAIDIGIIRNMLRRAKKAGVLAEVKDHFRMYRQDYSIYNSASMALYDWDV